MPLYEYECDACGGRFEVIQKFSEMTEQCRRCGKGPVRRLMSSPAIQFKGTGWYITDYAKKGSAGTDTKTGESKESGDSKESKESAKSKESKESKESKGSKESTSPTPSSSTTSTVKASGE